MTKDAYEGFKDNICDSCGYKANSAEDMWNHGLVCQNKEDMSPSMFRRIKGIFKKHQ